MNAFAQNTAEESSQYVQVGQQSPEIRESTLIPKYNQTMAQVRELLGDPQSHDDTGKPVISRWNYADKTVYFQDGRIIRTVVQEADIYRVQPEH